MQHLLTVRTGTVSGNPARNMAMRDSFARWLEAPSTLPTTISPTACGGSIKPGGVTGVINDGL